MRFIYDAKITVLLHTSKGTEEHIFDRDNYKSREEMFKAIREYYDEICSAID